MTKEQALSATVSLLTHVFESDVNSVATIMNADAEARVGNKEGIKTLVKALESVRDFVDKLITTIQEE